MKRIPKPIVLDHFYIVDLSNPKKISYIRTSFPSRDLARQAIEYYLEKDGVYDIYKGTKVSMLGIPRSKVKVPRFSPKAHRKLKNTDQRFRRLKLKEKGIRAHHFRVIWEDFPEDRLSRLKIFNKGREVIRYLILK